MPKGGWDYSSAAIIRRSAIIQGNMVAGDCQEGPSTCHSYMAADVLDKYQKWSVWLPFECKPWIEVSK